MTRLFAAKISALSLLLLLMSTVQASARDSIAFYYGPVDRIETLALYDRVILQPNQITREQIKQLKNLNTQVYAYYALVEQPTKGLTDALKPAVIGHNKVWNSQVMDLTHPAWQTQLRDRANQYHQMGFDGLFLDTVDSYQLTKPSNQRAQQQSAAINVIQTLSAIFDRKLIMNRGFEILSAVQSAIQAVVAESVLQGYAPDSGYFERTQADIQWITQQLKTVQAKGLEAIVIDYVADPKGRSDIAQQLSQLGFTPYVTDGLLQDFGVSHIQPVPNRVLALYDSENHSLPSSPIFRQFSLPFERAGYPLAYHDIKKSPLPKHMSQYAAIIVWLPLHEFAESDAFAQWLNTWQARGPLLWLDTPISTKVRKLLAIDYEELSISAKRQHWRFSDIQSLTGYETSIDTIRHMATHSLKLTSPTQQSLLSIKTKSGNKTLLAKTSWGVAAARHSLFATDPFQDVRWLIDPKVLIHDLLELPVIPVADVTTENGRRIATAHIDGDGFPSRANLPGTPFTADVIHREVLEHYTDIPTTVSVIEGEISPIGLHPKKAAELESIAKEIFSLPHVELASHSFSHPFYWGPQPKSFNDLYGRHLQIPNYTLNLEREILGSLAYINQKLAPPNKQATVFLWSGYADPTQETLALIKKAGVENVNGGNTYVTADKFLLGNISPTLIPYETGIQVLAPTMNENIYTDLWTRNFGGYGRAIETFQLLDKGARLKSIAIYYHMYSAEFPAALNALKSVYDWVLSQDINPMWLSDYAKRARYSYDLALGIPLAQASSDTAPQWTVASQGVTTVRLPQTLTHTLEKKWSYEPWANSDVGVVGWRQIHGDIYVHLANNKAQLMPKPHYDDRPYLKDSNGQILSWQKQLPGSAVYEIHFNMQAHAPLAMRFVNATHCALKYQPTQHNNTNENMQDIWRQAKPHTSDSSDGDGTELITFYLDKAPTGVEGRLICNL